MSIRLKVYDNGDHTCLVWLPDDGKTYSGCRGFSIRRVSKGQQTYLHGFVGFPTPTRSTQESLEIPGPALHVWDYSVRPGDTVQYSVVPVVGPKQGPALARPRQRQPADACHDHLRQSTPHVSSFFNKASWPPRWVARPACRRRPKEEQDQDLSRSRPTSLETPSASSPARDSLASRRDQKEQRQKSTPPGYELNDRS